MPALVMKGRCFANPTPMRSGMPASIAASAGRTVRSRIQILAKARAPQQRDQPHEIDAATQL